MRGRPPTPRERLQKIIASAGIASRRKAEGLILAGRVRLNGAVVRELGVKADAGKDKVEVDGRRVVRQPLVYIVMNKPRATVTTLSDPDERATVIDLVSGVGQRIFPVGRLDYNTTGVLLLTNDGEMTQALAHPSAQTPRVYQVKVQGQVTEDHMEQLLTGVQLDDGVARASGVKVVSRRPNNSTLQLTLYEGRYQEVRRMVQALGFRVSKLTRLSFAGLTAEGLAPGKWRRLSTREIARLKRDYLTPHKRSKRKP